MAGSRHIRPRRERLDEQAMAAAEERRRRMTKLGAVAVFAAIIVVAVMIAISQSGSGDEAPAGAAAGEEVVGVAATGELLAGLEQSGTVLGGPDPEVEIIEFGDLQCPICRAYSQDVVTPLIEQEVRDGTATIEFRNWAILGDQSLDAAKAALAAAEQGRYWQFVELFYLNQGSENTGYATDEFLRSIAAAAGVEDIEQWDADRRSARFDARLAATDSQATSAGFSGTPSFIVRGPGGELPLGTATIDQIRTAIKDASGA